jgi:hypothetical protein
MRIGLRLLMIGFMLISCSNADAAFVCLSVERLSPPSDEVKQKIERYLLDRYQADYMRIGRLDGDFYLAWPSLKTHLEFRPSGTALSEPVVCKSCFYHLIRQRDSDLTEFLAFVGGGAVMSTDMPGGPNRILRDDYDYYWLKQENKSYLYVGIPRAQGVPFVQASSSDAHLPSCE